MDTMLITGAAGNIGSQLRRAFQDRYRLVGADSRRYQTLVGDEKAFLVRVESSHLIEVFRAAGEGAVVIHLGAATWDDAGEEEIRRSNIEGTMNVFRLAQEFVARRVVFASTNHVAGGYGDWRPGQQTKEYTPPPMTITPEMPIRPDSFYGVSKAFGEALAAFYHTRHGLSTICLRIGSVTLKNDPTENPRLRSTWLSHRDMVHLFERSVAADVSFGIYYGVSRNTQRFWDISNAERELGYQPQDDAERWYAKK